MEDENNYRKRALVSLPFLQDIEWTDEEIVKFISASEMKIYQKDKLILGDISDQSEMIYFILSGECRYVREIEFLSSKNQHKQQHLHKIVYPGKENVHCGSPSIEVKSNALEAPSDESISHRKSCGNLKKALVQICVLSVGNYFAVGEDLRKTYIIAKNSVRCLLVPIHLMQNPRHRTLLQKLRITLENQLPSVQEIVEKYFETERWRYYRHKVILEVLSNQRAQNLNKRKVNNKKAKFR
ncbi:uncharacterized protein LOC143228283 [Tachypleus tridentatus]|uniref:uncharacterized protein LOC143228283 n=1 Tax=Tachypleus tridentatus TaxID=6853 RepID=UPI003FCEEE41